MEKPCCWIWCTQWIIVDWNLAQTATQSSIRKAGCFTQQRQCRCIQLSEPILSFEPQESKRHCFRLYYFTWAHDLRCFKLESQDKKFASYKHFWAGFTLSCLRQPAEPWPGYTVLPECQPDNILKNNREGQLPHCNLVENICISPLTPPTKRSTLWDVVLVVTSQCGWLVVTSQCLSTKEKVNFKKCPVTQELN